MGTVNLTLTSSLILLSDERVCYDTTMISRTSKFHKHNPIISYIYRQYAHTPYVCIWYYKVPYLR